MIKFVENRFEAQDPPEEPSSQLRFLPADPARERDLLEAEVDRFLPVSFFLQVHYLLLHQLLLGR